MCRERACLILSKNAITDGAGQPRRCPRAAHDPAVLLSGIVFSGLIGRAGINASAALACNLMGHCSAALLSLPLAICFRGLAFGETGGFFHVLNLRDW
jgi:hypothetical protein